MSTTNANPANGAFVVNGFSKQAISLIREAEEMGWTFRLTTHGANGRAPDGKTTISIARKLSGHGRAFQNAQAALRRWQRQHPNTGPYSEEMGDRIADNAAVVEQHLWKNSTRVLERHWSNDTVDYACTFNGCTYSAERPRSVSQHFGSVHTYAGTHEVIEAIKAEHSQPRGPMNPIDTALAIAARNTPIPVTIVMDESGAQVEQVRIGHAALDLSDLGPEPEPLPEEADEELAETAEAAEAAMALVDEDDPAEVESEPESEPGQQPDLVADLTESEATTDAEALDAIRRIVAAPLIADLRRMIETNETLLKRLAQVESERDALAERLANRNRDLSALRGLMEELTAE